MRQTTVCEDERNESLVNILYHVFISALRLCTLWGKIFKADLSFFLLHCITQGCMILVIYAY